jgi:hypothetical protein
MYIGLIPIAAYTEKLPFSVADSFQQGELGDL